MSAAKSLFYNGIEFLYGIYIKEIFNNVKKMDLSPEKTLTPFPVVNLPSLRRSKYSSVLRANLWWRPSQMMDAGDP